MTAHLDWKRKVLAGEIQLEERDTSAHRDRFGHLAKVAPDKGNVAAE